MISQPLINVDIAKAALKSKVFDKMGSIRTFYWLVRVANEAAVSDGIAIGEGWRATVMFDGSICVEVAGGKAKLAEMVGINSKRNTSLAFETLMLLHDIHLNLTSADQSFTGSLVPWVEWERSAPKTPSKILFVLSSMWNCKK